MQVLVCLQQIIFEATSGNRAAAILKISASVSIIITSREVIIERYEIILYQSELAHLYNHLSNYSKV